MDDQGLLEDDRTFAGEFAPIFRRQLADVDDVAVGRVLLSAAAANQVLADKGRDPEHVRNIFLLMALDFLADALADGA